MLAYKFQRPGAVKNAQRNLYDELRQHYRESLLK
jgi:hypothetical protein